MANKLALCLLCLAALLLHVCASGVDTQQSQSHAVSGIFEAAHRIASDEHVSQLISSFAIDHPVMQRLEKLATNATFANAVLQASPEFSLRIANAFASLSNSAMAVPQTHGSRPLAPDANPRDVNRVVAVMVQVNIILQFILGLICGRPIGLWGKCTSSFRPVFCNRLVWWSRELTLDYECLNPCACDAFQDSLTPMPGCLYCDFPNRIPPSPSTSWYAFNSKPSRIPGLELSKVQCALLPDSNPVTHCPPETKNEKSV
eukprot:c15283_g1_i1.p1 GENE.c15283_g1_i1~~c15283_g1_i1.p1  ORF type:complete len:259 (-),score=46.04 c15283_g1_i1:50-826(-)